MSITLSQAMDIINLRYQDVKIQTLMGEVLFDGIITANAIKQFGDREVLHITPKTRLIFTGDEIVSYFLIEVR